MCAWAASPRTADWAGAALPGREARRGVALERCPGGLAGCGERRADAGDDNRSIKGAAAGRSPYMGRLGAGGAGQGGAGRAEGGASHPAGPAPGPGRTPAGETSLRGWSLPSGVPRSREGSLPRLRRTTGSTLQGLDLQKPWDLPSPGVCLPQALLGH